MPPEDYFYSNTPTELGARTANVATFIAFSKIFAVVVSGLTFILVARMLGPSIYGIYTLALGVAGFFGAFGSLTTGPYYNKYIPYLMIKKESEKIKNMVGNSMLVLLLISGIITIVGIAFSGYIATYLFHNPQSGFVIAIAMLSVFLSTVYTAAYSVLVSLGSGKGYALAAVIYTIFQSAFSLTLVYFGFGAAGAVAGLVIGLFAGFLTGLITIRIRIGIKLAITSLGQSARELLGFSIPLTGASIIGNLVSNLGIIILGIFTVPAMVGAYGVASKIGNFIDVITGTIGLVLIPMFSTAIAREDMKEKVSKIYNASLYYGFLLSMPIIMYLAVLSGPFSLVFFTTKYVGVPLYMSLIGIGILIGLLGSYAYSLLVGIGRVKKIFLYTSVTGIIELAFILVLVPFTHVIGLIIGLSYAGGIAVNILYIKEMKNTMRIHLQANLARVIIVNVILSAILVLLLYLPIRPVLILISGILLLIFVYPMLLGAFRAISKKEIRTLGAISNSIPLFGSWLRAILAYALLFTREEEGA